MSDASSFDWAQAKNRNFGFTLAQMRGKETRAHFSHTWICNNSNRLENVKRA